MNLHGASLSMNFRGSVGLGCRDAAEAAAVCPQDPRKVVLLGAGDVATDAIHQMLS